MESEKTVETTTQTVFKLMKSALLALAALTGLMAFAFTIFLLTHSNPVLDIELTSVARDTTFYVGTGQGQVSTLSIRVMGEIDDSTARIFVAYPHHPLVAIQGTLAKGKVDQLWSGDYYDSQAKITFLHKAIRRGNLRLLVHFSHPPAEWGYQQTKQGWIKANRESQGTQKKSVPN